MQRIDLTTTSMSLAEMVKQVSRDRVPFEISEQQVPLARIVPIDAEHSLADLERALRELPRLGDDAEEFEREVLSTRISLGELDDPWES